jgi:hypothetical protein
MPTIFERFPGFVNNLAMAEQGIRPEPVLVAFTQAVVAGKYTFNLELPAFEQNGQEMVVLDGIKIAGNIDELVFSENLNTPFTLQAYRPGGNTVSAKWPFASYGQGEGFAALWLPASSQGGKESISFRLAGELNQGTLLIARPSVTLYVSANAYFVKQQIFEEFLNLSGN